MQNARARRSRTCRSASPFEGAGREERPARKVAGRPIHTDRGTAELHVKRHREHGFQGAAGARRAPRQRIGGRLRDTGRHPGQGRGRRLVHPEIAEVVKQNAELAWTQATPDHFKIAYHSGEGFPESIDLRQDILGKWTVEISSGYKKAQKIRRRRTRYPMRSRRPRSGVNVNRPRTYRIKTQKANWRKALPTNAQVREIRRMALNLNWQTMKPGRVADVLDFRKAQQQSRARQKVGVAQCSAHAPSSVASALVDRERSSRHRTRMFAYTPTPRSLSAPRARPGRSPSHLDALQGNRLATGHGRRHAYHQRPRVIGPRRKIRLADLGLDGVTQTILGRGPELGEPTSNGMQAALATVFGPPLDAVPHFPDTKSRMRAGGTA